MMRWLSIGVVFETFVPFSFYLIIIWIAIAAPALLYFSVLIYSVINYLGIIIIGVTFLKASDEPWLLQRQKVHFLIVYSKQGLPLFSKVFDKNLNENQTHLLVGGFSAITSMFQETIKTTGNIKSIILDDKQLRIINKEDFI